MFEELAVECLDVDMLAAVPFMSTNDINVRPARWHVILEDGKTWGYGDYCNANTNPQGTHSVRRA